MKKNSKQKFEELLKLKTGDEATDELLSDLTIIRNNTKDDGLPNGYAYGLNAEENFEQSAVMPIQELEDMSKEVVSNGQLYDDILEEFPDIDLGITMLASMIASPNDMKTTSITFESTHAVLPGSVLASLNQTVMAIVNKRTNLNLTRVLPNIIKTILKDGARIKAYLSPAQIKSFAGQTIGSNESNAYGITQDSDIITYINKFLVVTTDPSELMVGEDKITESNESLIPSRTQHYYSKEKDEEDLTKLFNIINPNYQLDTGDNKAVITMNLPVASVIPGVHKNDPSNHLVYYVLLDEDGFPISEEIPEEKTNNIIRNLVEEAKSVSIQEKKHNKVIGAEIIDKLIDNELYSLAIRPEHKRVLSTKTIETIYKTVFARIAKGKKVKVLVLPKECVSYMALDYHNNGIGKSILSGMLKDAADRTLINATTKVALIKAAIPTTHYDVQLDPKDVRPKATMAKVMGLVAETNEASYPGIIIKRDNLPDWLNRSGKTFNFKHPSFPDMTIEKDIRQQGATPPDDERENRTKKSMYHRLSLTPEILDSAYESDFASLGIANRALLVKRVTDEQLKLEPQLCKEIVAYISASGEHMTTLREVIKNGLDDDKKDNLTKEIKKMKMSEDFLYDKLATQYLQDSLVSLPTPDDPTDGLSTQYREYYEHFDTYLETYLSDEAITKGITDEDKEYLETLKVAMKGKLSRDWMRDKGYATELADMFNLDEEGKYNSDALDDYKSFVKSVNMLITGLKEEYKDMDDENNDDDDESTDNTEDGEEETEDEPQEDENSKDEDNIDDEGNKKDDADGLDSGGPSESDNQSLDIPTETTMTKDDRLKYFNIEKVINSKVNISKLYAAMYSSNNSVTKGAAALILSTHNVYQRKGAYVCVPPTDDLIYDPILYKVRSDLKLLADLKEALLGNKVLD